jgi:uncharacterized protein YlxP (DUF503 family)
MVVGILQIELLIHGAESIKDKRRVINSVKERLHREHRVSVAEVGDPDVLNAAVLGVACVAREGKRVGEVLDKIVSKLPAMSEAEVGMTTRRVISAESAAEASVESEDAGGALAAEMLRRAGDGEEAA